ncbi:MAG: tetratricopeptide repeat protein [Muribaculaceae bacterium]|nr:tetratricopeptide repeat protein [Muribaculaceae bacterium]
MRHSIALEIKLILGLLVAVATSTQMSAQQLAKQHVTTQDTIVWGLPIDNVELKRNSELMTVRMDIKLADYTLKGDRVSVFTPVLMKGNDSIELDPVGLYSRMRYIQYLRDEHGALGGQNETTFQYSKRPATMEIAQSVPFEQWMNGATLYIKRADYGCCHTILSEDIVPLGRWYETTYIPSFSYVTPEAEKVKMRELRGKAFIDFPVNMTELYPNYRNNPAELLKIIATIDSVRNDKDITIKEITIKGYASPESPYQNNTRLAKGRTATLKNYVQNLYQFDANLISTDFEPEDWDGLRAFVETSGLEHRKEILSIIDDSTLAPDPKEALIKSKYPTEYDFLLKTVYPALRHSDYTIEYTIRQYSDPDEIRTIMAVAPQKLSLDEMFVLAKTLAPGSNEYNEVFETAVRMYPNDETANLNAANSAMQRNDFENAAKYLDKAGQSDAAVYSRGVYATLTGDYPKAIELFGKVAGTMPEAQQALSTLNELMNL